MTRTGRAAFGAAFLIGASGFAHPALEPLRSLLGPILGAAVERRRGGDGLAGAVAGGVAGSIALALVDRTLLGMSPTAMVLLIDGSFGLFGIAVIRPALTFGMALGIWADPIGAKPAADRRVSVWLRAVEGRRSDPAGGRSSRP